MTTTPHTERAKPLRAHKLFRAAYRRLVVLADRIDHAGSNVPVQEIQQTLDKATDELFHYMQLKESFIEEEK